MPTLAYDPTQLALNTPGLRDTIFQDANYRHAGLDAICAECARLAYVDFDVSDTGMTRLADALALIGYAAPTKIVGADTGTQAFATVTTEGRVLVSFRGTQPQVIQDRLADADARMVPWAAGGQVHKGFFEAFASVAQQVSEALGRKTRDLPPIFTGHSLGAALATLAASTSPGATLVTFGSPRVGDRAFVATLDSAAIARYVDCCDVITKLPPPVPGFYVHCNDTPLYIDRDGEIRTGVSDFDKVIDQLAADALYVEKYALQREDVRVRELADHAPINYIRAFT